MNALRMWGKNNWAKSGVVSLTAAFLLSLGAVEAAAQAGGGPRLEPEKREAAWTLEAQGAAKELGLSEEAAAKLVEAYKACRKSHQEAVAGLSGGGAQGGPDRLQEYLKINDAERETLKKALAEFLTEEQVGKAIASLGTFNRQWDRFVDALAGLQLDGEKLDKGLALIAAYVVDSAAVHAKVVAGGDWQSTRTDVQGLKDKLDTALADVLSAEQLASWKEGTAFRGRREGGSTGAPGAGSAGTEAPQGGAN